MRNPSMPPAGPPRASQSSIRTTHPTPIIVPKPNVKYSIVLRPPCRCAAFEVCVDDIGEDYTAYARTCLATHAARCLATHAPRCLGTYGPRWLGSYAVECGVLSAPRCWG